jgi:hypothetical protein
MTATSTFNPAASLLCSSSSCAARTEMVTIDGAELAKVGWSLEVDSDGIRRPYCPRCKR